MRAVLIRQGPFGRRRIAVEPWPEPRQVSSGEVRIRVRAAGLNFADALMRRGLYPGAPRPPFVPGFEVAGEIETVGPEAPFAVGQRVLALMPSGGQAEQVVVPAAQVFPIPEAMPFEEAAALPVAYLTAYMALIEMAALKPGEWVLVHAAAGGVGLAALQIARTVPDVRILGTASAGKHALLRAQGCDHPIDYRRRDYEPEVRRLTGGAGVHVVLDPLGGRDTRKNYRLLRPTGRLVLYGLMRPFGGPRRRPLRALWEHLQAPCFHPLRLMWENRAVIGLHLGRLWAEAARLRNAMQTLLTWYAQGRIRPVIDRIYRLEEVALAHKRLEERQNAGKIVLVP
ncbi:MAG: medium chain dehydrogenase/reductase family protein [Bacteroidetes bacterium]|nr:medium chain dehydrogenase/reductase family protein [Rhodothermia bacterium]MCS7155762.1 medium chain dehydrogenase/reductase family protein [Bacteroidota bacterium]MCX7906137.1 medium chain dehydrogenase/reductase family protein [Bacteroidota bacterium]MDW8138265.1 medium chain dehydrogenase/reductase family protein [Bacteroidota bacterium]MDW8285949.1 medium chain dehydrogenase/reductase family protein [Bacteroidota bacterium]